MNKEQDNVKLIEEMDIRAVLKMPEGKRFLWKWIERCGVYRLSMNHSGSITYFNEGERNIGIGLLAEWAKVDPVSFSEMTVKYFKEKHK